MKRKNLDRLYFVLKLLEKGCNQQAADEIHTWLHDRQYFVAEVKVPHAATRKPSPTFYSKSACFKDWRPDGR